MHIRGSILEDFANFELDTSSIGLRSLSEQSVKLPYTGILPAEMPVAVSAYIYFNVQATQDVAVVLVVNTESGKQEKCSLDVSNGELISLLDKFFSQGENDKKPAGMDDFYFGQWRGLYMTWRKIVTMPICLLPILTTIPNDKKNYIINHIFDSF